MSAPVGCQAACSQPQSCRGWWVHLFTLACILFTHSGLADDLARREQELQQLRERIATIQDRITQARGERSRLSRQLQKSEKSIGRIARRLRTLRQQGRRVRQRIDELQTRQREQAATLRRQRQLLAQQVRAAYVMGRQERLRLVLDQDDPGEISRLLTYYDYLNRERVRRVSDIRRRLQALRQTQKALEQEQARLAALEQAQRERKRALEAEQLTRRRLVAKLAAEIEGQGARLTRLQRNEQQLQLLLRKLQDALADIPAETVQQTPFPQMRGKLPWPVKGVIRKAFGDPKIGQLRWDGVMIAAPEGREVRAVHAGRVAFADWLRGFGLLLIVDHGDGYMTLYGHNQSLFKEPGDWVQKGETIATVGDTGGRRETGIYFAIRRNGKPVDPLRWCRRVRRGKVG